MEAARGDTMGQHQKDKIGRLFGQLVEGHFDEFLAGCAADLVINVRGSSPVETTLIKSDVPDWFGSVQAMARSELRSAIEVGSVEGNQAVVILRHSFERNGVNYQLEMANLCEFHDGLLSSWSSYPLNLPEYERVWKLQELTALQLA
jgi:ketosteroid isomerase-like protein